MPTSPTSSKAIVIGAGIGGLASAVRLATKGYRVDLFDKNSTTGGKLVDFTLGDYRFDFGPSLFTMPNYVEELFTLANKNPKAYFDYLSLDEACRYFYQDGTQFTAPTNADKFTKQAAKTFNVEAKHIEKYFRYNENIFNKAGSIFLTKSMYSLKTFLNTKALNAVTQSYLVELTRSMATANKKQLKDPRLVQLFNRYATYNGSSPYKAPGILNSISILEHLHGTYFPVGGMSNITKAVTKLAEELGVKIHLNEEVTDIIYPGNKVKSVRTLKGIYEADIVVSNMDVSFTYDRLLGIRKLPFLQRNHEKSSSAVIFYWGVKKDFSQLGLHNIFFTKDYPAEFKALFDEKTLYDDPTIYVNITSKYSPEDAPVGHSNWFVMINAPTDEGQDWDNMINRLKARVINKLNEHLHIDMNALIEEEYIADPRIIQSKTLSHQGSLYGSSSNNWINAFLRHPNFSSKIKGLYFVGGSVHPGGGIPLCLLSAKIAAEQI